MDHLRALLSALATPTRRAILASLSAGEKTVSELAVPFDITMPAVTKHLKVLERAGLIERARVAQTRPCRLRAAPLKEVAGWVEGYREAWEQRLDRLGDFLVEINTSEEQ
jgi:DNA-binding transcriptional ArsR family regulator